MVIDTSASSDEEDIGPGDSLGLLLDVVVGILQG